MRWRACVLFRKVAGSFEGATSDSGESGDAEGSLLTDTTLSLHFSGLTGKYELILSCFSGDEGLAKDLGRLDWCLPGVAGAEGSDGRFLWESEIDGPSCRGPRHISS